MKRRKSLIFASLCLLELLLTSRTCDGFEPNTHAAISQRAVDASNLNNFLTGALPLDFSPAGVGQILKSGQYGTVQNPRVRDVIAEIGAKNEDKPFTRSRFHFHDPLQPWTNAGLRWPILGQVAESSVRWGQDQDQGLGGKHSWQDARLSYFNALTASDSDQRKSLFADTFESLGHLIHLVQDAATPAHTRNDTHISADLQFLGYPITIGDPDRFHQWANELSIVTSIGSSQSQTYDPSILSVPSNSLAPIPIAHIIDTEAYRGSGAPATPSALDNIGIAEYSNANFFSNDTILTGYTYPALGSMDSVQAPGPNTTALRFYLKKKFGPGETKNGNGYLAAVRSRLAGFLPAGFGTQQWELDDNVMADYGSLLFPRAIGYSAGLIDYFFRGTVEAIGCCAYKVDEILRGQRTAWGTDVNALSVYNYTVDEAVTTGSGVLVLGYTLGGASGYMISAPVSVGPIQPTFGVGPVDFTFAGGAPGPGYSCPCPAYLVYKGGLGQENNAVTVGPLLVVD